MNGNVSLLNTPSPFMERGPGGEVFRAPPATDDPSIN